MKHLISQSAYWLKVVALGVVLGFGIQFAQAWTNPTAPAPTGNVAGPVNMSALTQVKNGSLGLVGNLVANMIQVNGVATESSACSSNGLMARSASGELLSCRSGAWYKVSQAARLADTIRGGASCAVSGLRDYGGLANFGRATTIASGSWAKIQDAGWEYRFICLDGIAFLTDSIYGGGGGNQN